MKSVLKYDMKPTPASPYNSIKRFSKSKVFFKCFQKRLYSNLLSRLSLCLCTEGCLCVFLHKKIAFTHVSFKREVEKKLSLKKDCNTRVHVCLKSVKELKTTFYGLYSSFFTLRLPLCKFSLKKNKAFVDLSRRVKPFVYVF